AHAFLLAIGHFATRPGHICLVTPIGTGDACGLLPDRRSNAIHACVAPAEYHHMLSGKVDPWLRSSSDPACDAHLPADVGDKVGQRIVDARQVLSRQAAPHGRVGAKRKKHCVEVVEQFPEWPVLADARTEFELDPHTLQDAAAPLYDFLLKLERRNTEGQQAANFRVGVVHHRPDSGARQYIGCRKSGRSRTYDRNPFTRIRYMRHVGTPAELKRLVGYVFFDVADIHRTDAIIQRAGAFAQAILRAYAPADLGQRIRLVRKFRSLEQLAFLDQPEPVGNVVVHRALPLAVRIAAADTASCLAGRIRTVVGAIYLVVVPDAHLGRLFFRVAPRHFEKLQGMFGHDGACSGSLPQRADQGSEFGGFRLHQPELRQVGPEVV